VVFNYIYVQVIPHETALLERYQTSLPLIWK